VKTRVYGDSIGANAAFEEAFYAFSELYQYCDDGVSVNYDLPVQAAKFSAYQRQFRASFNMRSFLKKVSKSLMITEHRNN
jgi:hypothetical protein